MSKTHEARHVPYELTSDQLRKLIEIRAEIQKFNLDLIDYVKQIWSDESKRLHQDLCQTLLGSNFSLWRFAFLHYLGRDPKSVYEAMHAFISKLAEDNTMSFSREVASQAWLGGYYANNSRYRIGRLIEIIENEVGSNAILSIEGASSFREDIGKFYGLRRAGALKEVNH